MECRVMMAEFRMCWCVLVVTILKRVIAALTTFLRLIKISVKLSKKKEEIGSETNEGKERKKIKTSYKEGRDRNEKQKHEFFYSIFHAYIIEDTPETVQHSSVNHYKLNVC
jgi:hypothetical protein